MKHPNSSIVVAVLLALIAPVAVWSAEEVPSTRPNNVRTVDEADKAANSVVDSYNATVTHLIRQLEDGNLATGVHVRAVWALGQLRARAAARILVQYIDLKATDSDLKLR